MHSLKSLLCGLSKGRVVLQQPLLLLPGPVVERRLASGFLKPTLDFDDEDLDEPEQEHYFDPVYPILGNRYSDLFYMPHSVGPVYQGLVTTVDHFNDRAVGDETPSENTANRMEPIDIQTVRCPKLLLPYMQRLFLYPNGNFKNSQKLNIVNLSFFSDVDSAIKSFVLIASQFSLEILEKGYWADFVNPFTGRAYFRSVYSRKFVKDARYLGHNMVFKDVNGCTVIGETKKCKFSGAIFTDAPTTFFSMVGYTHE